MPAAPSHPQALDRAIRLHHATAMVVGTILGAAIFVQPSEISRLVPSVPGMLAVWAICGLLTFCGALVCAELASAFPQTGGVYIFLRETFPPLAGFLWGWAMFWSIHTGIISATAVIFARYLGVFIPYGDSGTRLVAIAAILLLSAINYLGVRPGSALQTALTLAKVLAVLVMLGFALVAAAPESAQAPASAEAAAGEFSLRGFGLALVAGLFAFGGWHMVTYAAGETRDAQRTVPRALLLGTLVVTACYIGLNAAYLHVLPLDRMIASDRVAADAATALVGPRGAAAISLLVMVSSLGTASGVILAGPRVYLAMAQDGLLFRWAGAIHPRHQTPHRAIVLQALWASLLVATGTYRQLFTRVIFTEWFFFALMALGVFILRRRADYAPAYRLWGYPFVPLLFVVASAAIVLNQLIADPKESALGLLLVGAGIPVYYLWLRPAARKGARADARD
jgi:APA family basic amino acid/polyamine antiporter